MSIDRLWCFYRFDRLWVGARLSLMLRCSGGRVVTRIQNLDCYYYQQSVKFGLKLAVSADIC